MPIVNATWRLHVDAETSEVTLHVEYASEDPPAAHEETHRRIVAKAAQLLAEFCTPEELRFARIEIANGEEVVTHTLDSRDVRIPQPGLLSH